MFLGYTNMHGDFIKYLKNVTAKMNYLIQEGIYTFKSICTGQLGSTANTT